MKNERTLPVFACSRLRMTVDGQGVTTLVTSVGCPLRCRECLNPQSWDGRAAVHPVTARELYEQTRIDELYFLATGGGVTFGGGEPLLHAPFIAEFRTVCGPQWHLSAETCLNVPWENVRIAADCIDEFIVDIKDTNPEIYRAYTGKDNAAALENLERLIGMIGSDRILVRVPRIPGFNTDADTERSIACLSEMGITRFDRFTYIKVNK